MILFWVRVETLALGISAVEIKKPGEEQKRPPTHLGQLEETFQLKRSAGQSVREKVTNRNLNIYLNKRAVQ